MTKKEIKERAQDELMAALQGAFEQENSPEVEAEIAKQFGRIEKLFGYVPGSFTRGV